MPFTYTDDSDEVPGYRDGIKTKTDFRGNAFGIDPPGCGCTDCIISDAFHPGDYRIERAIQQGRTLINRTGYEVILPNGFRLADGEAWTPGARGDSHCPGCRCHEF